MDAFSEWPHFVLAPLGIDMRMLPRSREAEAFLGALEGVAPDTVSACDGWTAHEITAHLAATAAEITKHLEPYLQGDSVPPTASFEEREPPFRALSDSELRERTVIEETKVRSVIAQVLEREPQAVIPWTGRQMVVAKFEPHLRSEFAIHRWDIVGDDQVSAELLAHPDLTEHAVGVLGQILLAKGTQHDPNSREEFHVRLRTPSGPDMRVVIEGDLATLVLTDVEGNEPGIELDAAARLLVIWGRRPSPPQRIRSHLEAASLARLFSVLSGY
jgi:hypothetical protein